MSPEQLIKKIKSLGFIDEAVIGRIQKELNTPGKKASVKGILAYLVKKGHLTNAQAKNMMASAAAPKQVKHEELEVATVEKVEYDTDDLTANVVEVAPVP